MPTSTEGLLLALGGLFLLIALIGGGFEIAAAKIPPVRKPARIGAAIGGTIFVALALRSMTLRQPPPMSDSAASQPPAAATSASSTPARTQSPDPATHKVYGEIAKKWDSLGGRSGFLGAPTSDELSTPDGIGRFNHFEGGSIYWTPATQAHEVHGLIRVKWASLGWERSFLGYPTSDEFQDGTDRRSNFEHGFIAWSPDKGAVVHRAN